MDISTVEPPADAEVEFDLAFQVPGEQAFRIRRKATVRVKGQTVVQIRIETADDPFSLLIETHS